MTRWLFWIAYEWAIIIAALTMAWTWPLTIPVAILIIGSRQQALLVLGHEAAHCTMGRDSRIDTVANLLCFWPMTSDVQAYRVSHLKHHVYLNTQDDPKVVLRSLNPWSWSDLTPRKKALLLAMDLVGLGAPEALRIIRPLIGRYTRLRIVWLSTTTLALILTGLWPLMLLWLWTLLTALMAFSRARSWCEHYGLGPGETRECNPRWWQRVYLPHYVWRHREHHKSGQWSRRAWDL